MSARTRADLATALIRLQRDVLAANVRTITPAEALQAAGGYRSIIGIMKHAAAFGDVYRSYAFEPQPRHLAQIAWPRGLRDTIETSPEYYAEIVAWLVRSCDEWIASLAPLADDAFDEQRPAHWGGTMALWDIVAIIAQHFSYHTGEINAVLAILRGEAWEYTEEVEENHISTAGHRLRPNWMSDEHAAAHERHMAQRDAELHPDGG
jgi:hypothetical protein